MGNFGIKIDLLKVKFSEILGEKLNPLSYNIKTLALKELIASNSLNKKSINELLISSIAGDWGLGNSNRKLHQQKL